MTDTNKLYVYEIGKNIGNYLDNKDPFESKYRLLINGRKKVGITKLKNPKAFIAYSQIIHDVYEK